MNNLVKGAGRILFVLLLSWSATEIYAQCNWYVLDVGGGTADSEITWDITDDMGVVQYSGSAPTTIYPCLEDGCFTVNMYDSGGDGWNGAVITLQDLFFNVIETFTIISGSSGDEVLALNTVCTSVDCQPFTINVTSGSDPGEISWSFLDSINVLATGFAPDNVPVCLDTGCHVIQMFDSWGDGWNGATWTVLDGGGGTVDSGTLSSGSIGLAEISIGGADCSTSSAITASDCADAVDICSDANFAVDPNGYGSVNEIPSLGSVSNPDYDGLFSYNPWGTTNMGCLRNGELNSTWMVLNVYGSGSLEFIFGGLGTQVGYYDWALWPYDASTCGAIASNTLAPIRCNWNGVSSGGTGLESGTLPAGADASNFEPGFPVLAGEQYIICFSNWSSVTTIVPLEFTGTAVIGCETLTLPIEFLNVSATVANEGIHIDWATTTDDVVEHFTVQRSKDMQEWVDIHQLPGSTSDLGTVEYHALDRNPVEGWNYYRIMQTDPDGSTDWSSQTSALWSPHEPTAFPNPSTGMFSLDLGPDVDPTNIKVVDAMGREVPFELDNQQGMDRISIQRPNSGFYYVVINHSDKPALKVVVEKE